MTFWKLFEKQWRRQCGGALILVFLVWAFLNTPDDKGWYVALSAALALAAFFSATWLVANNFTGAIRLKPAPLAKVAGCLIAVLFLLWLLAQWEDSDSFGNLAPWISSAAALKLKKVVPPQRVLGWLEWVVFGIRWIAMPLLFIPLITRAGGARPARYWRFLLIYLAAFLVGAVIPHYLVHWVPRLHGFRPQLLSAAIRFFAAYLILITAWVLLGRSVREEVRT
jgi:hypothetical protein